MHRHEQLSSETVNFSGIKAACAGVTLVLSGSAFINGKTVPVSAQIFGEAAAWVGFDAAGKMLTTADPTAFACLAYHEPDGWHVITHA